MRIAGIRVVMAVSLVSFFAAVRAGEVPAAGSRWDWAALAASCRDLNQDGKSDLAGWSASTGEWRVGLGNAGTLTSATWGRWSAQARWSPLLQGDFNGDGRMDVAGRTASTGDWYVGLSTGSLFTTSGWGRWSTNATWTYLLTGDFNGDGRTDIAGRVGATGEWQVGLSTGSSFVTTRWGKWSPLSNWTAIWAGDFNGDGKTDLAGRMETTGAWWVSLSTGSAFATSSWGKWSTGTEWAQTVAGDFNGDGKTDLAGRAASTGIWWISVSTGVKFSTANWGVWDAAATWADVRKGDFNGDRRDDLAGRNVATGQWWVQLAQAPGGFANVCFGKWSTATTWADVTARDFDGDGRTDLAGRAQGSGAWYLGLSSGAAFSTGKAGAWAAGTSWRMTCDGGRGSLPGDLAAKDAIVGNMRYVPAGVYVEGAASHPEPCVQGTEIQFAHTLTLDIAVMETEVTRQMWASLRSVQPALPADPTDTNYGAGMTNPVQQATWSDAILFANRLSVQNGFTPCYYQDELFTTPIDATNSHVGPYYCNWRASGYRLPSEGEWERFCLAGAAGAFCRNEPDFCLEWAGNPSTAGMYPVLETLAWFAANSAGSTHPAGARAANGWNLKDVHGNVAEWCWDGWVMNGRPESAVTDYRGEDASEHRAVRGGGWPDDAVLCRATDRSWAEYPFQGRNYVGFRLVRTLPEGPGAPPAILAPPQPQNIGACQQAALTVGAVGTAPFSIQWYQGKAGDTSVPVGDGSALFQGPVPAVPASYWVRVANRWGMADSPAVAVTLGQAAAITGHPEDQAVCAGSTATLTVTATGMAPLHFQWFEGASGNITRPVGTDSASFPTPALTATTQYWCRVTGDCVSADSAAAMVTVNAATAVTDEPDDAAVCAGSAATLTVCATGTGTLSYQWYEGAAGTTTAPVGTDSASFTTPALTSSAQYWCRVTGACGTADSAAAMVTVNAATTVADEPDSTTICAGSTATLTAGATGTGALSYQWYEGASGATTTPVGTNSSSFTTPALTSTTQYWCRVTGACGSADSAAATVTVNGATAVTDQPDDAAVCAGSTATLTVGATGTGTLSYQWYEGESGTTTTPVGTNSSSFTTPALSATTQYWCRVTGACGTVDSAAVTVTVNAATAVTDQPDDAAVCAGSTATLTVGASGTGTLSYQWYEGASGTTTTTVGTNSSSFTTPALTSTTQFWCRVTGDCGTVDSAAATVTVNAATTVTDEPDDTAACAGSTATLTVGATGTGPLSYQWYEGASGTTTTTVGTDSASFTTPALTSTTQYWCRVSGACGTADSSAATVTVNAATAMTDEPDDAAVCTGGTATLAVGATGTGALSYQWYEGASGATTAPVGTNSSSFTTPALAATTQYWCRVTGDCGSADSAAATVTVNAATAVTDGPDSTTICSGSAATLTVGATGTGALSYQWYEGASGATTAPVGTNSSSFTTPALAATTQYWCRVTGACGSADSAAATVMVAGSLVGPDPIVGNLRLIPAGAFLQGSPENEPCRQSDETQFTHVITNSFAMMETEVTRQMWADLSAFETELPADPTETSYGPSLTSPVINLSWFEAILFANLLSLQSGLERCYYTDSEFIDPINIGNYTNGTVYCNWNANGYRLPSEGEWEYACRAGAGTPFWIVEPYYSINTCQSYQSELFLELMKAAWFQANNTTNQVHPVGQKLSNPWNLKDTLGNVMEWCWDRYSDTYPSGIVSDYHGIETKSIRVVRSGSPIDSASTIRAAFRHKCTQSSRNRYQGFRLVRTISGATLQAPSIVECPVGNTICAGSTETLTVAAAGTAPFSIQWYQGTTGDTSIPVGTGSGSFTTPALTETTSYWVRISNIYGEVDSITVTVTVNETAVTDEPDDAAVCAGSAATLTVGASGTGTLSYQWYEGASGTTTAPVGTDSVSFTTPALAATTQYWCRVSGACSTADSAAATVTVNAATTVMDEPDDAAVCAGSTATLTVTATGAGLSYQWYEGASGTTTTPVGTDSASFPTPALTVTKTYWVRVTGACGSADSAAATVTVYSAGDLVGHESIVGNMRFVPAGSFLQGSPSLEPCRGSDETQFPHTLTQPFALMETEVTRQMWADLRAVQTTLPADPTSTGYGAGMMNPVQNVTWYQAVLFANLLSVQSGLTPCYYRDEDFLLPIDSGYYTVGPFYCRWDANGYRLPSEGEWEYACRAGTTTSFWLEEPDYSSGNCSGEQTLGMYPQLETTAWFMANSASGTQPVRTKAANGWNLSDMNGNVMEWCWDVYGTYPGSATDYRGKSSGNIRAVRGGCWSFSAGCCRSASRLDITQSNPYNFLGFRLVRTLP